MIKSRRWCEVRGARCAGLGARTPRTANRTPMLWLGALLGVVMAAAPARSQATHADSVRSDSLARFTLAPIEVTVTRAETD